MLRPQAHDQTQATDRVGNRSPRFIEKSHFSEDRPWAVTDAPAGYIDGQLRAIVGVELVIDRIEAKSKLSQNRSEADRSGVVAGLSAGDCAGQAVAAAMRPADPTC